MLPSEKDVVIIVTEELTMYLFAITLPFAVISPPTIKFEVAEPLILPLAVICPDVAIWSISNKLLDNAASQEPLIPAFVKDLIVDAFGPKDPEIVSSTCNRYLLADSSP